MLVIAARKEIKILLLLWIAFTVGFLIWSFVLVSIMFGYNTTAGFVAGVGIAQLFNFIIMIGYEKNTKRFLSFQKNNQPSQKIGFLKKVPISVLTFSSSANVNYNLVFNSFVLVVFSFYQEMVAQTIKEVIVGREEYMAAPAPGETTNATETT